MEAALPMSVVPVACLPPPPGLEDALTPMKVVPGQHRRSELKRDAEVHSDKQGASTSGATGDGGGNPTAWLTAALATAPYLDSQGLKQGLQILESSLASMKQAKVHEAAKGELQQLQQQQMLQQLRALAPPGAAVAATAPGAAHATLAAAASMIPGPYERLGTQILAEQQLQWQMQSQTMLTQQQQCQHQQPGLGPAGEAMTAQIRPQQLLSVPAGRQKQTLSASLQILASVDPTCLLIVRRINKLGFKASRKLKQHFSTYGAVIRVLVAHSTVKQRGDPTSCTRRRPSSLGFVHMALPSAVAEILKHGENQEVAGSFIRVQSFERNGYTAFAEAEDDQADGAVEEKPSEPAGTGGTDGTKLQLERQQTPGSMVSTSISCESEDSWHSSE